jgi:hypothetical protein
MEIALENINKGLQLHGFPVKLEGNQKIDKQAVIGFIEKLKEFCNESRNKNIPIEADGIIFLLCEVSNQRSSAFLGNAVMEQFITSLIDLIPLCALTGKSICKLFDVLRTGVSSSDVQCPRHSVSEAACLLPICFHEKVLNMLREYVVNCNPPHISLPGDKDSYLQLSSIPPPPSHAYTISMWVKLFPNPTMKGFLLYRCRSSSAGVDAIISSLPANITSESDEVSNANNVSLTIRSGCEKKQQKDEVQCKLRISEGIWHLITVQQAAMKEGADRVAVAVDGQVVLDAELLYPFNTPSNESIWIFGLGMKGLVSSISLYPTDVPMSVVQFLYSFGPHIATLTAGARCPQSSFDTGHLILGTLSAKGLMASKLCQFSPTFCVTATRVGPGARAPLITPGIIYPDHIDLQPRVAEHDEPLHCTCTGTTAIVTAAGSGGVDIWQDAGGCTLLLYMFWTYCDSKFDALVDNTENESDPDARLEMIKVGMCRTLSLIALLIERSTDFKEQFIQQHGFHVLGYCLSSLPESIKKKFLDTQFIDECISVVNALGPDSVKGDGIAAAMQGLLFDFRIWGSCDLLCLRHFLQQLTALLLESGPLIFKCIGVQRILDIFRLHVARKLSVSTSVQQISIKTNEVVTAEAESEAIAIECADSVHRLLIVSMEAALNSAIRNKTIMLPEVEALLKCLEETNSAVIAERILRIVGNLRMNAPQSLKQALQSVRFYDTAILPLLTKRGFSLEVRTNALCNLLWILAEEVKPISQQISQVRKTLNAALLANTGGGNNSNAGPGTGGNPSHRKSVSMLDSNRVKALNEQLEEMVKPLEKCWLSLTMIASVVQHAIDDDMWGKVPPSTFKSSAPSNAAAVMGPVDSQEYVAPSATGGGSLVADITPLVRVISHTGQYECWMMLPLLPVLLPHVDLNTTCAVLMSINVAFKTDNAQSEVLSIISTAGWIKLFLSLALLGEKAAQNCVVPEVLVGYAGAGAGAGSDSDLSVAATCTELALDCVAIVLEYKSRTEPLDYRIRSDHQKSRVVFTTLQSTLHTTCNAYFGENPKLTEYLESHFLRRIVSLLLHRISGNGDNWALNLIIRTANIFSMVEAKKLFGDLPSSFSNATGTADLLNLDQDDDPFVLTSTQAELDTEAQRSKAKMEMEAQIICFMFDISASLRRCSERGALQGFEWRALRISLRITLQVLPYASEQIADRIMPEILAQLKYLTEKWAPVTGNGFKSILMHILVALKDCINNKATPEYLQGRYSALLFGIMHSFIELRHSSSNGGHVSEQVLPALDALIGIDSCTDINLIFKLLDVTMRKADAISFEEVEVQTAAGEENSSQLEGGNMPTTDSYIALHRETYVPEEEETGGKPDLSTSEGNILDFSVNDGPSGDLIDNNSYIYDNEDSNSADGAAREGNTSMESNKEQIERIVIPHQTEDFYGTPAELESSSMSVDAPAMGVTGTATVPSSFSASAATATTAAMLAKSTNTGMKLLGNTTSDGIAGLGSATTASIYSSATIADAAAKELLYYQQWLRTRQGISSERVDSERARLSRSMDTLDLTSEATKKFWKKARRKVEAESFLQSHKCQWKLGVAHEGHFFARRRIVLRPRFDVHYGQVAESVSSFGDRDSGTSLAPAIVTKTSTDQLNRALAKACAGYIKDVTQRDAEVVTPSVSSSDGKDAPSLKPMAQWSAGSAAATTASGAEGSQVPGSGWGLVDADGSEEGGFGVVGIATTAENSALSSPAVDDSSTASEQQRMEPVVDDLLSPAVGDMQSDVRQLEENFKLGKVVTATGPCHTGTRRVGSGPALLESRVIMVTASGNFWGILSFNGKEIFFSSSFEPEDGHKDDNAAVNLVKMRRLRRRRWVVRI